MQSALRKLKIRLIGGRRDENGAALLEFAIIALPFLGLIFGMLEVGLIFWAGYELDNATLTASRLDQDGPSPNKELQQGGDGDRDLQPRGDLIQLHKQAPTHGSKFCEFQLRGKSARKAGCAPASNYNLGGGAQIELVTSSYEWPLFNFATVALLSNLPDGNRLIQSAAVFQNEPF